MDRKPKFRSRKLDFAKAMPIYRKDELTDIDEETLMARAVPVVATGVDKEEEEELHLQEALSAQAKASNAYIPTPEATETIEDYDEIFNADYKMPKSLIKFTQLAEECVSDPTLWYTIDDADQAWITKSKSLKGLTVDKFEYLFGRFESWSESDPSVDAVKNNLATLPAEISSEVARQVYEYWQQKKATGKPIIAKLKFEDISKVFDPYVCFRKREMRLNQRKTRRSDNQCLEKLRKLRQDLETVRLIFEMVAKRDKYKRESLLLEGLIFDQAMQLEKWKDEFGIQTKTSLPLIKVITGPFFANQKKKKKMLDYIDSTGKHRIEPVVDSIYVKSRKLTPLEKFTTTDDITARQVDRFSLAAEIANQMSTEYEQRLYMDRDFEHLPERYDDETRHPIHVPSTGLFLDHTRFHTFEPVQSIYKPFAAVDFASLNNLRVNSNYNHHSISASMGLRKPPINYAALLQGPPPPHLTPVPAGSVNFKKSTPGGTPKKNRNNNSIVKKEAPATVDRKK